MKKYLPTSIRLAALIVAGVLATFALVAPNAAEAQNTPENIRLMAEALRARDSGDLALAKEKVQALLRVDPNNENAQSLLSSINRQISYERTGGSTSTPAVSRQPANFTPSTSNNASGVRRPSFDPSPAPTMSAAEAILAAATADQVTKIMAAEQAIAESAKLAELGAYTDANALLNAAAASLTLNTATARTLEAIEVAKANVVLEQAKARAAAGDPKAAEALLEDYQAAGGESIAARNLARQLDRQISDPYALDIQEISPEYVAQSKLIRDLLTRGRAQYLNGDYDGASATFREVEARDANNAEAKLFQTKIAELLGGIHKQNHYKTREQMLTEVDQSWERPKVFDVSTTTTGPVDEGGRIQDKMNNIIIPQVNFSGMELTRVIETLSELSVEYDPDRVGVNIVPLFNSNDNNPRVNISLRNLNLDRILQFVTQQVNFAYDVGADAVTIQPSDGIDGQNTITEFFPLSRATVIRLTGVRGSGGSPSATADPFAAPATGGGSDGPNASDEVEALQAFFQSAGVNFELQGTSLAFDGEQLIITQTRRNLERMRTILRNYNEVKQVEIETKFLEVSQNDLEELGFDWAVGGNGKSAIFSTGNRSLSGALGLDNT